MLDALDGAAAAGFGTIELLDPYSVEPGDLVEALDYRGLSVDLFNLPMGDFGAGDRGFAGDPQRRVEFRDGVEAAVRDRRALGRAEGRCAGGPPHRRRDRVRTV